MTEHKSANLKWRHWENVHTYATQWCPPKKSM